MNGAPESLGIIAGNRNLPLVLAREARKAGIKKLVAVAFEGETAPELAPLVDDIVWLKVGQLSKMIQAFRDRGVAECVMVGQIAPKNLFDLRPDLRAMSLLLRLKQKNAHSIFGAIADELAKDGVRLIPAIPWLRSHLPGAGFSAGPEPAAGQLDDARYGFQIAREISRLEIGQSVVIKDGAVLAVEAFEGTDRCLQRGGELGKGGAVAVKVAKPTHDLRFDLPCVGARTLETCAAAGIAVLAVEAGKTLVIDMENIAALAKKNKVSFLALGET